MIQDEFKQILFKIFDALGFTEAEKEKALETFKKKLAFELLESLKKDLPQDQQEWLNQSDPDIKDIEFVKIQDTIKNLYTEEQLYEKTKLIFKKLLADYIDFMSQELGADETSSLKGIL